MATLQQAFEQLQSDSSLAKKFTENPSGTLEGLGVDTSKVHIKETTEKNAAKVSPDTVCFSLGEIICFSVG